MDGVDRRDARISRHHALLLRPRLPRQEISASPSQHRADSGREIFDSGAYRSSPFAPVVLDRANLAATTSLRLTLNSMGSFWRTESSATSNLNSSSHTGFKVFLQTFVFCCDSCG